ncbi:MAG: SMC-Scp complex subunit ScpB [Candidatus Zambryskibacteria bacterium]|nr:SMC-Scp complex subunit ScpB [Candidatus Zambryskibacteria bacterium]
MTNNLISKIEAILFYLAEPVEISFLAKTLDISTPDVEKTVGELGVLLQNRGVRLVFHNNEVMLVTAPEYSEIIEKIVKEERERDLGRAGIETLTIVAYKGPVSKKDIEYIRGVNCQWALRNLLLRGLVEKKGSEKDERVVLYSITFDTLRHLGLSRISDLPQYEKIRKQLEAVESSEEIAPTLEEVGEPTESVGYNQNEQ